MRIRQLIGWASIVVMILATAFVAYSIWFCASELHGDLQGCIASAGGAALLSPLTGGAFILGVAGLILAGRKPP
ncbi:MAG: hypothetical protein HXY21_08015 [Parvularculaceae bacterium]|nr:hypothetical protein [Parvularculaceae bacterium]